MSTKRLYRSKKDKIVAGVCGGLAEYLDLDPTIIRLLWIISIFVFGTGFLLYIAAMLIVPENKDQIIIEKKTDASVNKSRGNWNMAIGVVLLLFGAILLLDQFHVFDHGWFRFHIFPWRLLWPLLLIGVGVYFVTSGVSVEKTAKSVKDWASENRLYKSADDKMIAGVCGGLARHFDMDPSVVRILAVVIALFTAGFAFLGYIVMALILPNAKEGYASAEPEKENNGA